jgi:hypothetical protein
MDEPVRNDFWIFAIFVMECVREMSEKGDNMSEGQPHITHFLLVACTNTAFPCIHHMLGKLCFVYNRPQRNMLALFSSLKKSNASVAVKPVTSGLFLYGWYSLVICLYRIFA